ncbi:hypothetical protein PEC18_10485 [Paucibacter sp. O1-1]|nr:hypothetical protein [Paucibacter sp. O1-1]MDA3826257.1 hypothetical protein [Paucibacter sp. O1-1]
MQLLDQAKRLHCKVELLMDHQVLTEGDRDTAELNVTRQFLHPSLQRRLERTAVRAAIGEELQHFNLVRVLGGLPWRNLQVVLARHELFLGSRGVGYGEGQGKCKAAERASFDHDDLWIGGRTGK